MKWLRNTILEIVLVILCVFLSFRARGFLSAENLLKILGDVSMQGIIAFGMTMVIIAGEIDLSVGSAVAFSGCIAAWIVERLTRDNVPAAASIVLAIGAAIAANMLAGVLSGFFRIRFRVPTFISTLAWMAILRGGAKLITHGFPINSFPQGFSFLGAGYIGDIPFPAIVFVAVFLVIQGIMTFTTFGRSVYAVGGNAEAARLSGIGVGRVKIAVMAIVAGLAAIAGIMLSSRLLSGNPESAVGWELDVITAVIIGGTSLMGGAGRVWGTLIGVVFLGVLSNGMTLMNVDEYWQVVARGILIFVAVLVNQAQPGRR
ncbi:MAG TPA: ABC transporter permease [Phycisphaerae bacterium]|nr:ABC transporter permease [Phycisphaerae bacterium]